MLYTIDEQIKKIETILQEIRPQILMHGGDVQLVKIENKRVYVRLLGACIGCPVSIYTVKLGIEQAIKDKLADVEEVVNLED